MKKILLITALSLVSMFGHASLTLPSFFTDNMIVQQNAVLTLPVTTTSRQEVTVTASWGKIVKVKASLTGIANIQIPTPAAGGPYSLVVTTLNDTIRLINVLSGEVWLCSGQSNMEFPVNGWTHVMNFDDVIGNSHRPDIRLLQIKDVTSFVPQENTEVTMGGWVECNAATIPYFSALAYLYAVRLHDELGVPVGVIDCAWGGTPAEAWTSANALGAVPGFAKELKMLKKARGNRRVMESEWKKLFDERMAKANSRIPQFDKGYLQNSWPKMPVPGFWEDNVAPWLDGIVYAQTSIELSEKEASSSLELYLGAIDDEDVTYMNGKEVANGSGFATPRHYTVSPAFLHAGTNILTIQITDMGGEGGFRAAPEDIKAVSCERTIPLAGDWGYKIGVNFAEFEPLPASVGGSSFPSVLYNAMLHPLHVMPIKGVLWYQGCANVGRAEQYELLFKSLIADWRELWGYNMPFYFVQLAGWLNPKALQPDSPWAALRNAQMKALSLDNTSMVTAIDLGNPSDIHPRNKQEVARRLANTALTRDYGKDYDYVAPKIVNTECKDNRIVLSFDKPLAPKSSAVTGFIIGDGNGKFAVAKGQLIDVAKVELSAMEIDKPLVARYNWADYPGGNLYGKNGLPVVPFATDK